MTTAQLTTEHISTVLDGLYGCKSTASPVEAPKAVAGRKVVATYNDADGEFRYAINCELKLANSLGAALTMIPPGGAEDATAEGCVPENIAENLNEVLNICSAIFADYAHQRIVLDQVILPGQDLASEMSEKLDAGEMLLQLDYELQRYESGKFTLLRIS